MLPNLLTPPPYLDPGSGSLLIQLAIATLLGLGVLVRSQWARIKKLFGVKSAEIDEDNDDDKKNE